MQSYENSKIDHGVFTESVLEAFGSRFAQADTDTNGKLSADELFAEVTTSCDHI